MQSEAASAMLFTISEGGGMVGTRAGSEGIVDDPVGADRSSVMPMPRQELPRGGLADIKLGGDRDSRPGPIDIGTHDQTTLEFTVKANLRGRVVSLLLGG